jgi:two-component system chemotaxis sensor kinase CheA
MMDIDDKYKQGFQTEARDVLTELESALLGLTENRGDSELVARAFRALHTIKGTGSMFGFDQVAAFTHHVENAFDRVRSGRLAMTEDLINLALAAVDQIRAMLDEAAGRGRAEETVSTAILGLLEKLTGTPEGATDAKPASPPSSCESPASAVASASASAWRIGFRPHPDLLRNGANPLLLLRDLGRLGSLEIQVDTSAVPALSELEADVCYLSWDLRLHTTASENDIRDVFIFVEDSCELTLEPIAAAAPSRDALPAAEPVERRSGVPRRASDGAMASSIRVAAVKLDQLVDLVGQLVTVEARLGDLAARSENSDLQSVAEDIEGLIAELRETSMSMRTVPLRSTFERFKRLVYDLGRSLHKEVEFSFEGGETELDKSVIDQLNDPLMHLIRNSMDHGIEAPEERRAAGKATARVHLAARYAGAQVLISVADDGKGIDREAVRARAVEKGLVASDARLSDA